MSKFDEVLATYADDAKTHGISNELLTAVAKGLGPSIYNNDASRVSGGDQSEKDRVKTNFLIKKLGLADGPELDKAIDATIEKMGTSNRNKWRAVFYALLTKHFKKEGVYGL